MPLLSKNMEKALYCTSYAQERFLFLEEYELGTSTYNIPLYLPLTDDLDKEKLIEALRCVMQRHEVLRTRFVLDNTGSYFQEVCLDGFLSIEEQVDPNEFVHRSFNLKKEVPLRAGFFENYLLIVVHHIVFDAWSDRIFKEEIWKYYNQKKLLPLKIQYKDFAAWQRKQVESRWDELRDYWKQRLSGMEILQLPTDYPRPSHSNYQGTSITFALPFEIQFFSQHHQTTLFTTCLTALGLLLSRYTGQKDLVIGTPVANRQHPQLAPLIGFFLNILVIRLSIEDQSFIDLLNQVQLDLIEAQTYQDMP
ncbi:condensation domain-containing protein, partial [Legionella oakridgensis]|uniref:condensation domain-containing protein n=1 Tax=Legionella oakridgensis TaxID=29423 RepID=UPI00056459B5